MMIYLVILILVAVGSFIAGALTQKKNEIF